MSFNKKKKNYTHFHTVHAVTINNRSTYLLKRKNTLGDN